jgi:DNA-binding transcriptional LysR family regulator
LTPDQQLAAFDDGRIDIGFTRKLPLDRREKFEQETVYTDELGIALSRSHPLAKQKVVRLKALAGEPACAPGAENGRAAHQPIALTPHGYIVSPVVMCWSILARSRI